MVTRPAGFAANNRARARARVRVRIRSRRPVTAWAIQHSSFVVSDKRGPPAAERPDLSEKKLCSIRQGTIAHVLVNVHVLVHVLGSWALSVIPAYAGTQKRRRHVVQGRVGCSAGATKYEEPSTSTCTCTCTRTCTKGGHSLKKREVSDKRMAAPLPRSSFLPLDASRQQHLMLGADGFRVLIDASDKCRQVFSNVAQARHFVHKAFAGAVNGP